MIRVPWLAQCHVRLDQPKPKRLRGPVGGHVVWSASDARNPLLLVGGGSGVVSLTWMLRHRRMSGSAVLYSCRTREDVIYHKEIGEIAQSDSQLHAPHYTDPRTSAGLVGSRRTD